MHLFNFFVIKRFDYTIERLNLLNPSKSLRLVITIWMQTFRLPPKSTYSLTHSLIHSFT